MSKYTLLLTILWLPALMVSAQTPTGPTPSNISSPETRQSMMAKNGAPNLAGLYNVDLYSGTASANIPIYSYSVNNLDLGVSLNYSMNGIRVDDRSGICGLGWNLASNGYISREVHGIEDEVAIPMTIPNWNGTVYHCGSWVPANYQLNYTQEKEHDAFTAVFGGRTIRFQMDNPSTQAYGIKTYPNSGIRIKTVVENAQSSAGPNGGEQVLTFYSDLEPNNRRIGVNENQNVLKFYLYDEYGNTFVFTRGEYEYKTRHLDDGSDFHYCATTRWNLVQVTTATGLTVNYTYSPWAAKYDAYKSEQIKENYQAYSGESAGYFTEENKVVVWDGKTSQLEQIAYPNGVTVDLDYRHDFDSYPALVNPLDNIVISSRYDGNVKHQQRYNFSYSFFQSPWDSYTLPADIPYGNMGTLVNRYNFTGRPLADVEKQIENGLRLRLDKITTVSEDGQGNYDAYTFSYNSTPLPRRLSPGRDYYGYANGKQPVSNLPNLQPLGPDLTFLNGLSIVQHPIAGTSLSYGVDKMPDFNYACAGLLNTIQTAAGGNITFLFKEHQLYNPKWGYQGITAGNIIFNPVIHPTYEGENANDGICIDEIVLTDGFNNDNTTRTRYAFSGGQRFMRGGFSWYEYFNADAHMYTNNFVAPMPFVNGANHGYTYAEVKNYGFNNQFLGSTKYHYTNLIQEDDTTQSALKIRPETWANVCPVEYFYQYRMGRPLHITTYDQNGTAVKQVQYAYADSLSELIGSNYNPSRNAIMLQNLEGRTVQYFNFHAIPFRQRNKTETTYTNNGPFVKSVDYTFDTKDNVTSSSWLDEFSNRNTKRYFYGYNEVFFPAQWYVPTRTELYRNINGTDYLVDANSTGYDIVNDNFGNLQKMRFKSASRLVNEGLETPPIWGSSPNVKLQEQVTAYDSKSNPTEVKHEDKEQYTATIWDTRIGQKAAVADNAKSSEIAYTSFEGTFQPRGTTDDDKGHWEFSPGQISYIAPTAATQPMTGHYYYQLDGAGIDSKNVLTQGKKYLVTFWAGGAPGITGATVTMAPAIQQQKGYWYFYAAEVTGTGNALHLAGNGILIDELRLYPADATMVTTTYEPLFGPNSNADANGNINYYEYDGLGRQTVVRDIDRNVLSVTKQVVHGADVY